jgi:1-aminocyclopropane-1-carboxylate deaminase/D-cysteine desulfhydrase-like pyridoxal-dependent ACC family enzyme
MVENYPTGSASVQKILQKQSEEKGLEVYMLREDLLGGDMQGNKWRKLRLHIEKAKMDGQDTLLSFGGPWSNHLYALAAAGRDFGFKTIGVIRGEEPVPLTDTLEFAKSCGMKLHFVSRAEYAEKEQDYFKAWLHDTYGAFHLIPEGGADFLGVNGCIDILAEKAKSFDVICVACGTGTTLAGMLLAMHPRNRFIGFSAVKGGEYIKDLITSRLNYFLMSEEEALSYSPYFNVISDYAFGGFAKVNDELLNFMQAFYQTEEIMLDPLYTGKMMYGISDLIEKGRFVPGTKILAVHTGGLQGLKGIERKTGKSLY